MSNWKPHILAVPAVGVSLLPKLACPACWPAYAALLSAVGLGFLISKTYLIPLTAAFLLLSLFALAFRATRRRGYRPFVVGSVAALGIMPGKFVWESNSVMYTAIAMLLIASVWNAWPRRSGWPAPVGCDGCDEVRETRS
jgi:hypothetical protein